MSDINVLVSLPRRIGFVILITVVGALTLAAALRYNTPLDGLQNTSLRQMNSGWSYEDGDALIDLEQLPCQLEYANDILYLNHDLTDVQPYPSDVLAIQTRYQSIQVWVDQTLVYEAAQGRQHALSSMWHFIPTGQFNGASNLRIELTKYDDSTSWDLSLAYLDNPDSIAMGLLMERLPIILVWLFCVMFTLLMIFVMCLMARHKMTGIMIVLSLAAFVFMSGTWVLLDSKITTIFGGNYALTYFCSYCVFYLMPIPLMFYFQLMLGLKNRVLRYLIWITAGNAGLWMLLHLLDIVQIRNTEESIHLIIIAFLITIMWEFFHKKQHHFKRLVYTFWGIILIFIAAIVSLVLYHAELLPPTNNAVLYAWSIIILILCMTMDAIMMFGHIWKEQQYVAFYRQLATQDSMTQLLNRNAYELRLRELAANAPAKISFINFDIDMMKMINDTHGHNAGDQVITLTAQCMTEVFGSWGDCYRIGGDEFCVISTADADIAAMLRQFDALVSARNTHPFQLRISHGWETRNFNAGDTINIEDIIELKNVSDMNLYRDKFSHQSMQ